jgi:Surface adhesin CshA non-repetitive domain 2/GEVED domain
MQSFFEQLRQLQSNPQRTIKTFMHSPGMQSQKKHNNFSLLKLPISKGGKWISHLMLLGTVMTGSLTGVANAAPVTHLTTQTATATGAGATGTPSIATFNIPSGKNRVLFIWAAFERDHCSPTDVTNSLCNILTTNTTGTGLGDNWPEPRTGTPPATTTINQITAQLVGPGGTINKKNALTIGGTPSGDTRFFVVSSSPGSAPAGSALYSLGSFHILLSEDEIHTLLGGAASGTVSITLPDVSNPNNVGDDAILIASVYQNVEQTAWGMVRNATASAQLTVTGPPKYTPGNYSMAITAYDGSPGGGAPAQTPDEADDGKLIMGLSSTTEGFVTPTSHASLATSSIANNNGTFDTPSTLSASFATNEPSGISAGAFFRNGGATPGSLATLTSAASASTQVYGGLLTSFLLESDNADISDAPISYGSPTHTIVNGIRIGAAVDADAGLLNSSNATGDDTNGTDDEDGVTIPTLTQGRSATISVNVNQVTAGTGRLQGWIDWNGDGNFSGVSEQIATNLQLSTGTSGTISVPVTVPANAITSTPTFARFRWSTTASLNSTNTATDGEVEDYSVTVVVNQPPDTTSFTGPTQTNPGGTSTVIIPPLSGTDPEDTSLGTGSSFKIATLPTNGTLYYNGVQITAPNFIINNYDPTKLTIDPNDGAITVSFTYAAIDSAGKEDPTPATVAMPFTVANAITCPVGSTASGSGYATGGIGQYITRNAIYWLDWSCGATTQFNPGDTVTKTWTAPNGISVTATVSNITKTLHPYNTGSWGGDKLDDLYTGVNPIGLRNLNASEDPSYKITFSMTLNGVPIPSDIVTAEAEDTGWSNESATWTTDGDPWQPLEAAPNSSLKTTFSNGGKTIYMDDNPDGGGGVLVALTENVSNITVNMNAGGNEAIAFGIMIPFDYGDAPATYGSASHYTRRHASGGSQPTTPTNVNSLTMATLSYNIPYLGAIGSDPEKANQPTANADGDKLNGDNDEDAFTTLPNIPASGTYSLNNIPVNNATGNPGTLYAWVDFNRNGVFEASEFTNTTVASNTTSANLSWTIPSSIATGTTYARFRLTTQALTDNTETPAVDERSIGVASDGEVEDYQVTLKGANILLVKRITAINGVDLNVYKDDTTSTHAADDNSPNWPAPLNINASLGDTTVSSFLRGAIDAGKVKPGDTIEYTIYFLNAGNADASGVRICDRILGVQQLNGTAIELQQNTSPTSLTSAADGDRATFYPISSAAANCNFTNSPTADNGAVVVDVTGATGTPTWSVLTGSTGQSTPNSYGFIRFTTRVNP